MSFKFNWIASFVLVVTPMGFKHKGTNKNNYCLGFIETQCKLDCQTAVFVSSVMHLEERRGKEHCMATLKKLCGRLSVRMKPQVMSNV